MEKKVFSYFLLVMLILVGIISLNLLPKESQPDVQIPIAIINVPYFGSSAEQVEQQVTDEIEKTIQNITEIEKITSASQNGSASITIQFEQTADIDEKIEEIKEKVDTIKNSLPSGASDYTVSDINFSDAPVFSFALFSNENNFQLKQTVDNLQEELEKVAGVSQVNFQGIPEMEYSIWLDEKKIEQYNLSFSQIQQKISSSNILIPAGSIEVANQEYVLDIQSKIENISDLENITIKNFPHNVLFLKDIARIEKNFKETSTTSQIFFQDRRERKNSIIFNISKEKGYNILELTESLREKLVEQKEVTGIEYKIILDMGEYAWKDIQNLSQNGMTTTLLVFLILIFILKTKDAFIAAIGIPISFLVAFIFFLLVGNTINFISLFSMILAIGILVDSDIVITEGIAKRKEEAKKKHPEWSSEQQEKWAGKTAIENLAGPMLAGTATTIAVFAPLLFLSGVTGDFIKNIPFTIIFILVASQVVSIFFIPLLHSVRFKKRFTLPNIFSIKRLNFTRIEKWYSHALNYFLGKRKRENIFVAFIVLFFFATLALPITGLLKAQFFPGGDVDLIYINIEMERGSHKDEVTRYISQIEQELEEKSYYNSIISTQGKTSDFNNAISSGDRFGNILLNFTDEEKSNGQTHIAQLRDELEEKGYQYAKVFTQEGGPPTGAPIDLKIVGDDFKDVQASALLVENILRENNDVINIESAFEKNMIGFDLILDRAKASLLHIDLSSVSSKILAKTSGIEVFEIKDGNDKIEALIKIAPRERTSDQQNVFSPEEILLTKIRNNNGDYVYLSSFMKAVPTTKSSSLNHYNQKKSISLTADIKPEANLTEIITQIKQQFKDQSGYKANLEFGGDFAEQEKSFGETGLSFLIGIASIFGILIFLFNSIRLPLIIESVIPLAFSGVIIGLFATGNMISFPAILGFIALSGIIVNNSIILIYVYEEERKKKLEALEKLQKEDIEKIVHDGSISRLRPILLTTLTTIIGVLPLLSSSAIWAPIAYTIIFGLLFATIITLAFIPILYRKFYPK